MALTFEEFQAQVEQWWPNAGEKGAFRNFTAEGKIEQGRTYYTWQNLVNGGFGAAAYDSKDEPNPWMVDNGRGSHGFGASITEADAKERELYDSSFQ